MSDIGSGIGKATPRASLRRHRWRHRTVAAAAAVTMALAGSLAAVAGTPASAATVDQDGWYVLVNRGSGKALDVAGSGAGDGANIQQWTRHDGTNQQWQFVDSGDSHHRLRARHSGKVLDVSGWSTADGANIVQWADHNGANQQFRLADSPDGYVRLVNRNSSKAVEVQGGSTADGANVVQYTDWGGANQQWLPVRVDDPGQGGSLPSSFQWSSSGVLAGPRPDAQHPDPVAVKDFTVVRHNNQWLIYATTPSPSTGWGLVFYSFSDWSQAATAPHTYLDTVSGIGPGYRAAPQLFYFEPQNLWYLVYQSPRPTFHTSTDPADPHSWSGPQYFMNTEPDIVQQNKGDGGWIDFFVICDSASCYLFFSDNNGNLYRAQTSLGNFPNGFGNTVIVMSDPNRFALFEGANVYRVQGTDQYLLMVEAIGSDGRRYYRSWTSNSLTGSWSPLADTQNNPFARSNNVSFPGGAWTQDISHGELVRAGNDQTLPISPCDLQLVYQGQDPNAGGDYLSLPWRMGLLTQTNSPC